MNPRILDPKAYRIWRGCARKVNRYKHEGQAKREAHARGLGTYKCRYCGNWHLTSKRNDAKETRHAG